jgi:hypothetical protein
MSIVSDATEADTQSQVQLKSPSTPYWRHWQSGFFIVGQSHIWCMYPQVTIDQPKFKPMALRLVNDQGRNEVHVLCSDNHVYRLKVTFKWVAFDPDRFNQWYCHCHVSVRRLSQRTSPVTMSAWLMRDGEKELDEPCVFQEQWKHFCASDRTGHQSIRHPWCLSQCESLLPHRKMMLANITPTLAPLVDTAAPLAVHDGGADTVPAASDTTRDPVAIAEFPVMFWIHPLVLWLFWLLVLMLLVPLLVWLVSALPISVLFVLFNMVAALQIILD